MQNLIEETTTNLKELNMEVICIEPDKSITEAAKLMRENHIGDVVVTERRNGKNTPLGIITDRDITLQTSAQGVEPEKVLVSDIMTKSIETVRDTDDVFEMIKKMKECGVSRLPVVSKDGNLTGIVTAKTLFKCLVEGLNDLSNLSEKQRENEKELRH